MKPTLRNEPSTAPAHQPPAVEADDDVLIEEDGSEVKYVDSNLDGLLSSGFLDGNQESIDLLYSILESDISVMNYQHSEKGVTILMVAAAWGAKAGVIFSFKKSLPFLIFFMLGRFYRFSR